MHSMEMSGPVEIAKIANGKDYTQCPPPVKVDVNAVIHRMLMFCVISPDWGLIRDILAHVGANWSHLR